MLIREGAISEEYHGKPLVMIPSASDAQLSDGNPMKEFIGSSVKDVDYMSSVKDS